MPYNSGGPAAWLIACALALSAAGGPRLAAQAVQRPAFRSGVDLIVVDAAVVDRNGKPVAGLRPDQFEVTLDGKPRRVVSADFVEFVPHDQPQRADAAVEPVVPPRFSSNERVPASPAQGRLIFLAIDQGSFKPLAARGAMEAARRFIDRLQPADRVGLVVFPAPGPSVPATRNHDAARAATAQVIGRATPFRMEGLDKNVSLGEAIDIRAGDAITTQKVLARECAGMGNSNRPACELEVRNTALSIGRNAELQATRSLSGIEAIIRSLAPIRERKTLVLVSAGLPVSDRASMDLQLLPEMTSIGREAASANLNFFVLHVDSGFLDAFSAEQRTISDTLDRDLSLMSGGLETIAGSSGGSLVRIVAGADFAFERVQRETSAAYVLGVEPVEGDRDGRPHRISVRVSVPDAQVRSRRDVMLPKGAVAPSGPATPEETLAAVLRADRLETALPIRLATINLAPNAPGRQRVFLGADIGVGAAGPADLWTGFTISDASGKMQPVVGGKQRLRPRAAGPAGAVSFTTEMSLAPGRYSLRFAVIDAAGRAGSVDHVLTVGLAGGPHVLVSDLLLMEPLAAGEERLDIITDGVVRADAVDGYVEVVPTAPLVPVPDVTFTVSGASGGEPLVSAPGLVVRPPASVHWSATARLDLGVLDPGDYVVTAVVSLDGREAVKVERFIHVQPRPEPQLLPGEITAARADRRVPALHANSQLVPAIPRHAGG